MFGKILQQQTYNIYYLLVAHNITTQVGGQTSTYSNLFGELRAHP